MKTRVVKRETRVVKQTRVVKNRNTFYENGSSPTDNLLIIQLESQSTDYSKSRYSYDVLRERENNNLVLTSSPVVGVVGLPYLLCCCSYLA